MQWVRNLIAHKYTMMGQKGLYYAACCAPIVELVFCVFLV